MIFVFKHIITHNRVTLELYDSANNRVTIQDNDGNEITMTIQAFHKNYEYVWMSH